jgi:tetratricopeptide (TPR) repeat protein
MSVNRSIEKRRAELAQLQRLKSEGAKTGTIKFATAYHNLGCVLFDQGEVHEGLVYLEKAANCFEEEARNKSVKLANTLRKVGHECFEQGNYARAREYLTKAVEIFEKEQPKNFDQGRDCKVIADVCFYQEEYNVAWLFYQKALDFERRAPNSVDIATIYFNIGQVEPFLNHGDLQSTQEWFEMALEIRQEKAPNSLEVAETSIRLANILLCRGDEAQAHRCYETASSIVRQRNNATAISTDLSFICSNLGHYMHYQGDRRQARYYYKIALKIDEVQNPDSFQLAGDYFDLGLISYDDGELGEACEWYQRAMHIYDSRSNKDQPIATTFTAFIAANAYFGMGQIHHDREQFELAHQYYKKALATLMSIEPNKLKSLLSLDPRPLPTLEQVEQAFVNQVHR